ncbi:MAG: AraC family transcriptional regulator [Holdemanella sp.]|nr:AraC family transcriptional regulator [Holdemanella sp.]
MENTVLFHLLQMFSQSYKIPIYILAGESLIAGYEPKYTMDVDKRKKAFTFQPDTECSYYISEHNLQFGYIQHEEYLIHIGPVLPCAIQSVETFKQIVIDDLDYDGPIRDVKEFFNACNYYALEDFQNIIITIYESITHKRSKVIPIIKESSNTKQATMPPESEKLMNSFMDNVKHNMIVARQIEEYIAHGMIDYVKNLDFFSSFTVDPIVSEMDLRRNKDLVIVFLTFCARASFKGGVNYMEISRMIDRYLNEIEAARTYNDLKRISTSMKITFCLKVHELSLVEFKHPTVRKIVNYINNNIQDKIYVQEIADYFGFTKEYLSTLFKKETNMTITDYIKTEKIRLAKKLLRATDLPLIDISNMLSFSSQSYFQSVFKEVEHCTPKEYRNKNKVLL